MDRMIANHEIMKLSTWYFCIYALMADNVMQAQILSTYVASTFAAQLLLVNRGSIGQVEKKGTSVKLSLQGLQTDPPTQEHHT